MIFSAGALFLQVFVAEVPIVVWAKHVPNGGTETECIASCDRSVAKVSVEAQAITVVNTRKSARRKRIALQETQC